MIVQGSSNHQILARTQDLMQEPSNRNRMLLDAPGDQSFPLTKSATKP